jgi:hypothetical protein
MGNEEKTREAIDLILQKAIPQLPEACRHTCTSELVTEHAKLVGDDYRYVNKSWNESETYYAIHNEDLKLIDESAAIAAGLWALTSNPIAVIGKLLALLYRYRRKRARLTVEQGLVLLSLKQAPPQGWSEREILQALRGQCNFRPEELHTILGSLKNVVRADGTTSDFVTEQPQGYWRAIDV